MRASRSSLNSDPSCRKRLDTFRVAARGATVVQLDQRDGMVGQDASAPADFSHSLAPGWAAGKRRYSYRLDTDPTLRVHGV
jgi:hypothetical protein